MNSVFCLFRCDTDGYTYSAEILLGVFLTEDDADTALLGHIAAMERLNTFRLKYEAECDELRRIMNQSFKESQKDPAPNDRQAQKAKAQLAVKSVDSPYVVEYQQKRQAAEDAYLAESLGASMMSFDIKDYLIREMEVGKVIPD